MSIRPVDFNGMLQRTDDVGMVKVREDHKPLQDQQNIQVQVEHRQEQTLHQVVTSGNSSQTKNQTDARQEGRNKYFASSGKKKRADAEGKVVRKEQGGRFDLTI